MARTKSEVKAELAKYTKQDIINALAAMRNVAVMLDVLGHCKAEHLRKLIAENDAYHDAATDAAVELAEWQREMCEKYGDGKNSKIADIPREELARCSDIQIRRERAWKAAKAHDKKLAAAMGQRDG